MGKLTTLAPDLKLRNVVMPATHDSASSTISKWTLFSAVGLCQNTSIYEQLKRGARYLDIRIGGTPTSASVDDVFICHGILKGGNFGNVMEEVSEFLTENPGEFVVMEVVYVNIHEMPPEQRLRVFQLMESTFGDRMISQEDTKTWFKVKNVTLGTIRQKSKNILLLIDDRICNFTVNGKLYDDKTVAQEFGCHKNALFMKNKWHNTQCTQQLLKSNEQFLNDVGRNEKVLVNSQFVLTPMPPSGVQDAIKLLTGVNSLRPVSLVRQLYKKDVLEKFVRDRGGDNWNLVLLDFIDLCPQFVRFLIGLNSPRTLEVLEATLATKDGDEVGVKSAAKELVKRNCTLYLLDFQQDLGLAVSEGTLHLKYKFDDDESVDCVIPFDQDTEYLICDDSFLCRDDEQD